MNIKLTDKALRYFLDTSATAENIADYVSQCGPTFDRVSKVAGDYLYEIEIITNRIDSASVQGVARESVAILNQMGIDSVMKNDPYQEKINLFSDQPKTFTFEISDANLCPRFTAISLENISISESPKETRDLLTFCGQRPINNAVDITNELTILYGMPIHIFDLDKLATQKLIIRESHKNEEITTLDNQKNILTGGDIIIEDGAGRIVDLCGIMGGSIPEVDIHTKNILLIVPTYHPNKVRRTSLYLQKRTLAVQIYEKQPDPELCLPVLMQAIKLFKDRVGAHVSSAVYNSNPKLYQGKEITIDTNWVNALIGINISPASMISILKNLGFQITEKSQDKIICTVPSWRQFDINIKEDLAEEIARVYGYSKLPPVLPSVNLPPETESSQLKTELKIKNCISYQGYNEIYNSSLISADLINKVGLNLSSHLRLTNALSVDYEYLRTSLVPSILQNIKNNQGKSKEPFRFFELSNIYQTSIEKLPQEISKLVIASTEDFRKVKGFLELLFSYLNLKSFKFEPANASPTYFVKESTAKIISKENELGYIGLIQPTILYDFGITSNPTIIELNIESIASTIQKNYIYKPISDFPEVIEQMTISSKLGIGEIIGKIQSTGKLINKISYLDSYQNNHTFEIIFSSPTKNLTQIEVNSIKKDIQTLFK